MLRVLARRCLPQAQCVPRFDTSIVRSFASVELAQPSGSEANSSAQLREDDTITITATPRAASGTRASERLRKEGRTPCILFSLPGNESQLIGVDTKEITKLVTSYGRNGFASRVFNLEVAGNERESAETYHVLPRLTHINAATSTIENITFMHLPPERRVKLRIPVQTIGEDISPGVKRGGWVNVVERTVLCSCEGSAIPPHIEIDVSAMDHGQPLSLGQLSGMLPPGVQLIAKDLGHPVCMISGRGKREAAAAAAT